MNIMIIGAGFTGIQLAKKLVDEKNEVTIIENNTEVASHIGSRVDCKVFQADGNNMENLENAGISKMDALITLTESDEMNMITCSLVDTVYPNILKIARVRNYSYYTNKNQVTKKHEDTFSGKHRPLYGIDFMINPDIEAAEAIVKAVEHGAVSDILTFGEDYEITALQIAKNSKFDGQALKNLRTLTPNKFIVVYVESKGTSSLPSGNTILHAGDRIGILTKAECIQSLLELCGAKTDVLKKIVLVGAGRIGTLITNKLIEKKPKAFFPKFFQGISTNQNTLRNLTIVDSNKERCKEATEKFPTARVLNGDITEGGIVEEEKLFEYDLAIAATHNHEMNMVISAYMESLGVGKTIALVAQSSFADIARKLGIEVAVPLRDTIVDSIMSHLRGKNVTGIHTISNGAFEIVECDLPSTSKFTGKALKDIASPGEYLLLLIKKIGQDYYELPAGNTILAAGDHLVIIEKTGNKKILERFSGAN